MLSLKLWLLESTWDVVRILSLLSEQRKCRLVACSLEAKAARNPVFFVCSHGPSLYLSSCCRLQTQSLPELPLIYLAVYWEKLKECFGL